MTIIELRPDHAAALSLFFAELPAGDLTFIEEDVSDPAQVRSLAVSARGRWLAVDDQAPERSSVTGYLAVRRLPGWSDHVARSASWCTPRTAAPGWAARWPGTRWSRR